MSDPAIQYVSYEEILYVYGKTIEHSGGGLRGVLYPEKVASYLEFMRNDDYYPDFISKLSYLVYRLCSGHCFMDGNKRIALTVGVYFLHKNAYFWQATIFMKRLEAIIYHIAAGVIDDELTYEIMKSVVNNIDFSEDIQIRIAKAINQGTLACV